MYWLLSAFMTDGPLALMLPRALALVSRRSRREAESFSLPATLLVDLLSTGNTRQGLNKHGTVLESRSRLPPVPGRSTCT